MFSAPPILYASIMPPLDPAEDFEDEGESLHQRRMREIIAAPRASRRAATRWRVAICAFFCFPLTTVAGAAGMAWGVFSYGATAAWLVALSILFVAAVWGGVELKRASGMLAARHRY